MFPKIGVPPKSSIFIGVSIISTIHFWDTSIFGNTHIPVPWMGECHAFSPEVRHHDLRTHGGRRHLMHFFLVLFVFGRFPKQTSPLQKSANVAWYVEKNLEIPTKYQSFLDYGLQLFCFRKYEIAREDPYKSSWNVSRF